MKCVNNYLTNVNSQRRRFTKLLLASTLVPLANCGGGGGDQSSANSISPPRTGVQAATLATGATAYLISDPRITVSGEIYTQSILGNDVPFAIRAQNATVSLELRFDTTNNLTQIVDIQSGFTINVIRMADRIEYRYYNAANIFQFGYVIFVDSGVLFSGLIPREIYGALSNLTSVTDFTAAYAKFTHDLTANTSSLGSAMDKIASKLAPIGCAEAAGLIDDFSASVTLRVAGQGHTILFSSTIVGLALSSTISQNSIISSIGGGVDGLLA